MRAIAAFDSDDVRECGDVLRGVARTTRSMEEASTAVVRFLYDELGDGEGGRACPLVRLYKTHPFGDLPASVRDFAGGVLGEAPADDVRCLTLLGTAGDEPDWNDRHRSRGHQAIPLPSEQLVAQLPMVRQLITQLGLSVSTVIRPDPEHARRLSQQTYDVFHVPDAVGSPHVPAQDFVREHGIRSAIGFGGMLFTGDFYAVVLFSKVPITAPVAQMLKILSLPVRVPLLAHLQRVFDTD
jgi:hypothetical protein